MPNYTENFQLIKPLENENYDVNVANINNTKIDEILKSIDSRAKKNTEDTNKFEIDVIKNNDLINSMILTLFKIAIENGFEGTLTEWIASLSQLPITALEINKDSGDDKYPTAKTVYNALNSLNNISEIILEARTQISNGYEIKLPFQYKVGSNMLEVYWNGIKLIKATEEKDGHYEEIGNLNEFSNVIKFHRTEEDGIYTLSENVILNITVRGVID